MMEKSSRRASWMLGGFYAAHFAHIGIVLPFLPPWFSSLGLSAFSIGILLAVPAVCKILTPWTWGALVSRRDLRTQVLGSCLLLAALSFAALGLPRSFALILTVMIGYSFTLAPVLPLAEVCAMEQVERTGIAYGRLRLWGSVSFIVAATGFGMMRDVAPEWTGFIIGAFLLVLASICGFRFPVSRRIDDSPVSKAGSKDVERASGRSGESRLVLVRFLAAGTLMQASHGPYYAFFSIRLGDLGFGGSTIGGLWALAVIAEVLLFYRIDGVLSRLRTSFVLRICLTAAAFRWFATAGATSLIGLGLCQILHALTYAAFHVGALKEVARRFDPSRRSWGQALYSGCSFGIGMLLGNFLAGLLADHWGLDGLFRGAALVAGIGVLVVPTLPRTARRA